MYIYKITNRINQKIYIGQSIRAIEKRFQRHINDALNNTVDTHLARAIREYGPENFTIELIDTAQSQQELNSKWRNAICDKRFYYNYSELKCIDYA